jgi:hypothetical protein
MRLNAGHIFSAILLTGFIFTGLTMFAPNPDQKIFGVYFDPDLSQHQVLELLSDTSLTYAGFSSEGNIIVLSGDRSELDNQKISDEIWFVFNPNGFKACGNYFKKLAFVN